jgi:hypothetical protein
MTSCSDKWREVAAASDAKFGVAPASRRRYSIRLSGILNEKEWKIERSDTGSRGPHFLWLAQPLNDFQLKLGKALIFCGTFMAESFKNHFMFRG